METAETDGGIERVAVIPLSNPCYSITHLHRHEQWCPEKCFHRGGQAGEPKPKSLSWSLRTSVIYCGIKPENCQ